MQIRPLLVLFAVACSGKATSPVASPSTPEIADKAKVAPPAPPSGPLVQMLSLAEVGLDPGSLDRTADPCVDFFQFACGGWLTANEIPADKARWGRFSEIDEHNKTVIKQLLDDDANAGAAGPSANADAKKLGDYYASCMDEATVETTGRKGIKSLLDKAENVKDAASWFAALIELHKAQINVLWETSAAPDLKDSTTNITQLDAAGLGLPDRDYYLDDKFKAKLEAYKVHVKNILALDHRPNPATAAGDVVAIETELATLTKTAVERRDVRASYNPIDAAGIANQVKSVDWTAYWKGLGFTPSAKINVGTPKFLQAMDALRAKFKPAQWSNYFTYHVVQESAFTLGRAFDNEAFELDKIVSGVEKQRERYKRCIDLTTAGLGELLGKQYADTYFSPTAKQTAMTLVDAIVDAMRDDLSTLDWMSEPTRRVAIGKLAKIVRMVGYPDTWRTYDFAVKRNDLAGNVMRANQFEAHRQRAKSGKPYDRTEWLMNSFTVNAYYEPSANNTALPAGILQPPFFGADRGIAVNMGGIGMVIGHELTHGFDDQGSQFDGDGNLKNWWQDADKQKFDAKGTCVADQYSTFEAMPNQFVQGRLTLGENIADLGGVKNAFRAYRAVRKGADKHIVADGFSEDQQFFISVGQAWCSKDRPAEIQRRLTVDPHAPPKFRVFGALRNLSEFSTAFSCSAGAPMHPQHSCAVW